MVCFCVRIDVGGCSCLEKASVASIKPQDLVEYATMEPRVQKLVREALALTTKGLGYRIRLEFPEE